MVASYTTSPDPENGFIGVGEIYWKGSSDTHWRHVGQSPKFDWKPAVTTIDWDQNMGTGTGVIARYKKFTTKQAGAIDVDLEEGTVANWLLALMAGAGSAVVSSTVSDFVTSSGSTDLNGISPVSALVDNRRYKIGGPGIPAGDSFVYNGGSASPMGTLDAPAILTGTVTGSGTITSIGQASAKIFSQAQMNGAIMFVGRNQIGAPVLAEFRNVAATPTGTISLIGDGSKVGQLNITAEVSVDTGGDLGHFEVDIDTAYKPYLGA